MNPNLPCDDYTETRGIVFFARMVDKIRLHAKGVLPGDYNLGFSNPTSFDARFCRFWEIDYEKLRQRTLEGGSNEEIFDAVFQGRNLIPEHILVWNGFLTKRGWRDGSDEIFKLKESLGLQNRDDIQTYIDLHDIDEGRKPRYSV